MDEKAKKPARRYNANKLRYELISQIGLKELADVYTKGAAKYTLLNPDGSIKEDGADNWRKGFSWMDTMASVKRHIEQWVGGEEIDQDLKTKHLANAAWGLFALLDFEKNHPEYDDRNHKYLKIPKIGLDIDDVLADFVPTFAKKYKIPMPTSWDYSYKKNEVFDYLVKHPKEMKAFYLSLPMKIKPEEIPFTPHCYITSRSMPKEWTEEWLEKNKYPCKPVLTVPYETSKIEVAKKSGIEIFVDDKIETFIEFNNAGICCYLMDNSWNQRIEVGYKRIKTLKEILNFA